MPEFRVRFVGDLGNLAQFDRAIRNSLAASARELEAANLKLARSSGVGPVSAFDPKTSGAGRFTVNQKSVIDSVNRTMRQSYDQIRRTISGYNVELNKVTGLHEVKPIFSTQYLASVDKAVGNLTRYEAALLRVAGTEKKIDAEQLRSAQQSAAIRDQIRENELRKAGLVAAQGSIRETKQVDLTAPVGSARFNTYGDAIRDAEDKLKSIEAKILTRTQGFFQLDPSKEITPLLQKLEAGFAGGGLTYVSTLQNEIRDRKDRIARAGGTGGASSPQEIKQLENEIRDLETVLNQVPNNINYSKAELVSALKGYEAGLANETAHIGQEIALLEAEIKKLSLTDSRGAARLQRRVNKLKAANPAYADLTEAANATPPINSGLKKALEESKQLRKELVQNGLGLGARYDTRDDSEFVKNLAKQEANVTKFNKNMRTGVTSIEGSVKAFNKATGQFDIDEKFTADIDKNGKVITRWGGQLSGTGQILRQTVRDFQKVIEWTIATTAVFGTLGLAISSLSTINDLNAALTRFSITAQTSLSGARDIFRDLGKVAIDTATPLVDLVKVADDIALATKSAGDSSDEWRAKIVDLTTAVGIFTNLTGSETVEGADKLTSAFKQLAIAPRDLIGVLNKVTAVAGGQSTAINDIVTALGGVAEAGKVALGDGPEALDQMIALVQTLGQVTNKSAADTATAFKNLFGSISSRGSEKILGEFGIEVRDPQTKALRSFLDIYRDINKALEQGIIPAARYQDVLRGISGGPRRAPDAAALLANLPAVEEAITRAAGASNEALIANAKILDTNQAKIIQLKNEFDIALFQKFGQAVQDATAGITDLLIGILDLFNKLDPNLLSLLLTLGAILAVGKILGGLGGKLGASLIGAFVGIGRSVRNALGDFKQFSREATLLQAFGTAAPKVNKAGKLYDPKTGKLVPNQQYAQTGILPTTIAASTTKAAIKTVAQKTFGPITKIGGRELPENVGKIAGRTKGTLGAGALVGGLLAVNAALNSTDSSAKQTIGQMLQLAGTVSIATGAFAPLGVAALIAGGVLQAFNNDVQETKQSAHDASVAVYEAVQQLKTARQGVVVAETAQQAAKNSLDNLNTKGLSDSQVKIAQTNATQKYVDATFALVDANKAASDSYDGLLDKIPSLGEKYKDLKDIFLLGGGIGSGPLQDLSEELAAEILKVQNLGNLTVNPLDTHYTAPPLTAPIAPQLQAGYQKGLIPAFDESLFKPENLKKLFDLGQGGKLTTLGKEIPHSQQNEGRLLASLDDIISGRAKVDLNPEQIDILVGAVHDFVAGQDSFYAAQQHALSLQARVTSLTQIGALTGEKALAAQQRADLVTQLSEQLRSTNLGPQPDKESRLAGAPSTSGVTREEVLKLINQISSGTLTGEALSTDELKKAAEILLAMKGTLGDLAGISDLALRQGMAKALIDIGISADVANKAFGLTGVEVAQSAEEVERLLQLTEDFGKAADSALSKYAARNADLQQRANSGDFEKNAKGLAILQAQSEAAYKSEMKLVTAFQALATGSAEDQARLSLLQQELAKVTGFEDAALIPTNELAARFIDQAIAAGVNAAGIRKLQGDIAKLIILGDALNRVKAEFHLKAVVNVKDAIRQLEALFKATLLFAQSGAAGPAARGIGEYLRSLRAAIDELKAIQSEVGGNSSNGNLINDINKIIGSGTGSNIGTSPSGSGSGSKTTKPKAGYDVSNLDLPDEIANASNRDALIQEAIKRAKLLQSKIPGANKEAKNDIVELLKGTQRILEVRGVKDDLLRKALEELAEIEKKKLDFETKADTIQRIRVGTGSFAALANVPVNSKTGVSLGSPQGPINITLNLNGTVLTPAQLAQFADLVAAALKRQISGA